MNRMFSALIATFALAGAIVACGGTGEEPTEGASAEKKTDVVATADKAADSTEIQSHISPETGCSSCVAKTCIAACKQDGYATGKCLTSPDPDGLCCDCY